MIARALWGAGLTLLLLAPSSRADPSSFTVTLSPAELNTLGTILRKQLVVPWEEVNPIIQKAQGQIDQQRAPPLPKVPDANAKSPPPG